MHPTAKLSLNEPSAFKLARRDCYRWVFEKKPTGKGVDENFGAVPRFMGVK
jgi:hypothetical protein